MGADTFAEFQGAKEQGACKSAASTQCEENYSARGQPHPKFKLCRLNYLLTIFSEKRIHNGA